jgi:hypothetical protein
MSDVTSEALGVVGLGLAIGGGLGAVGGAVNHLPVAQSAVAGAAGGAALTALGGLIWAIFSKANRDEALEVAGLGLGATIVAQLL